MRVSSTEEAAGNAFGAILTELRALIPRALLDGSGWERLLERVGELPGAEVASRCGFEFRLGEAAPTTDFFVALGPGGGGGGCLPNTIFDRERPRRPVPRRRRSPDTSSGTVSPSPP